MRSLQRCSSLGSPQISVTAKIALGAILFALGVLILSGFDKKPETLAVDPTAGLADFPHDTLLACEKISGQPRPSGGGTGTFKRVVGYCQERGQPVADVAVLVSTLLNLINQGDALLPDARSMGQYF